MQSEESGESKGLADLPNEILFQIISFLEPSQSTSLQLVSKKLLEICRDNTFWRSQCFENSTFLESLCRRQRLLGCFGEPGRSADAPGTDQGPVLGRPDPATSRRNERLRIMANWDPSFPGENVNWYDEYIQRNAPINVNWLQQPVLRDGVESTCIETRGIALYTPENAQQDHQGLETVLAVSPLDDGSVCVWDVTGTKGRKGAICARSRPGILYIDGPSADNSSRSKRIDSGVTECVSVDSRQHLAFFAVQNHLIEVDLRRLTVVGCESFPWSITALSTTDAGVPLTVGTNNGIHPYDHRYRAARQSDSSERVDDTDGLRALDVYTRSLKALFDNNPLPPYAPLSHPGPLSILHMQRPGAEADRFPSILSYDRRMFPSIKGSLHSGARLSSLASLPVPFSTVDNELRREGLLSPQQIETSKTTPPGGRTLIACGEYNTKGSLEMYGLQPPSQSSTSVPGGLSNSVFKNRQSSSDSKLLSCVNQGTRLVCSDGSGRLKWFERDGFTEVRRVKIGHCERAQGPSLFANMPGSDDIARKLLATQGGKSGVNGNELLFWTGENLGLVAFKSSPAFTAEDFEEEARSAAELEKEKEERIYSEKMRQALLKQADDVRFVRNLGLRA
ncbi:hypothetical protein KVR01_006732 [Diaporthe batatas]|uniref:uncharacterized protein n=1 Tax=Diaporthe batatas TaxID=748121 RepID=UPI001D03C8A1|nr:uncharacterized protein KVR01_006732 [Diaporthe batatas]KAG8163435.1 hypothetical protein KVR01_006732 [Diaporthe batatas]